MSPGANGFATERLLMSPDFIASLLVCAALLVYLAVALLRPERF
jgi:K+-transporting ATPase KdpF subunit